MATRSRRRRRREPRKEGDPPPKPASLQSIMERAFRILGARSRGIEELRRRLMERDNATTEIVEQAIVKLIDYGYLDDEKYARDFSLSKIRTRPMGRRRLSRDLKNKHLDEKLINKTMDEVFETYPEESLVVGLVEQHERQQGLPSNYTVVKKLSSKLLRRGFEPSIVRDKTGDLWQKAKDQAGDNEEEEARVEEDRSEEMDAFIAKFIRIKGTPSNFKEAKKLSDRLMRRGFKYDQIREKVDPLWKS